MIIKKIELIGDNKPTALLEFGKGLNVIVGPSNTGKSYVIQCLKYVFGATKKPKSIKQSKGYTDVKVTLEDDNKFTIITRNLKDGKTVNIEEIDENKVRTSDDFKITHAKGLGNLSNYFLNKFGLNDKIILKGKEKLTNASMSLRVLEQVLIMDEARIVGEHSPLGSGDKGDKTIEASFLRTLLTNQDDSSVKLLIPKVKEFDRNKRKIEDLNGIIETIYPYDTDSLLVEKSSLENNVNDLELKYLSVNEKISDYFSSSKKQLEIKEKITMDIERVSNRIKEDYILKSRFSLLIDKYVSDKNRLAAINESTRQFQNYSYVACPTCERIFSDDQTPDNEKMMAVLDSTFAEIEKIDDKIREIKKSIVDIESSISRNKLDLDEFNEELKAIETKHKHENLYFDMQDFNLIHAEIINKRKQLYKIEHKINEKSRISEEIESLTSKNDDLNVEYVQPGYLSEQKSFSKKVENILKRWGFPEYKPTTYDETTRDLVIGDSPRSDFGKGYRAISCSAYIIGLMESMEERHPGFVVLDSPITTFKDADKDAGEEMDPDDEVSEDVIYAFYRDLCDSYLDKQVIVFENREPDPSLIDKMRYQQFTRKKSAGRYGFFPV
ncbi:coiled-coil domain-containing protein [Vibrio parahaemolyticus]|uniref:hypothetical protein n=1 Tax=Vibrio parahaemolyticus TaxID=670 RepID=UPI00040F3795|nr:hypothetical protein [Vibrio parahaemolyticus]HCH6231682.1 hypothetical protein [Vibrio parahaemolyticus]HCM1461396.1 hypothetical protein [Vibrio parahaemolyticus]HCM1465531.1 hypothetical protein [Vibrio parahaemolyticus]